MKLVIPLHFISWKKITNNAVTPKRQSQFTPKMKANAVPHLLSSLVWIDQYNECNIMTNFKEFMSKAFWKCNSMTLARWLEVTSCLVKQLIVCIFTSSDHSTCSHLPLGDLIWQISWVMTGSEPLYMVLKVTIDAKA